MRKRDKEPTSVGIVLDYLRAVDDYKTAKEISSATRLTMNRVFASLHSLHGYKCVEFFKSGESLYWYALDPEMDTRIRVVKERVMEEPGTRRRKKKKI